MALFFSVAGCHCCFSLRIFGFLQFPSNSEMLYSLHDIKLNPSLLARITECDPKKNVALNFTEDLSNILPSHKSPFS